MPKPPRYRRILWPTDFSPIAKAALPYAADMATERGADLVLLHVLPSVPPYAVAEISGAFLDRLDRETRSKAAAELRKLAAGGKHPGLRTRTVVAKGVTFDQILRVARRLRCDLIVLATHGRTGLRHVLMGSVAENVVRRAPCPVLTVRPPKFRS